MRKINEPRKVIPLHMPLALFERLERYMLQYIGSAYGKNEIINKALSDFLDRKYGNTTTTPTS